MEINNEVWRPVVGYEGLYEVSNYGRVKRLERVIYKSNIKGTTYPATYNEKILSPVKHKLGYLYVNLRTENDGVHFCLIHRLVAIAFIPNPNNYSEVNHKDENKTNNNVENLEWCDRRYNMQYGGIPDATKNRFSKKVAQIDNGNVVKIFNSAADAANKLGLSTSSHISSVCRGIEKKAYGFEWKYIQ